MKNGLLVGTLLTLLIAPSAQAQVPPGASTGPVSGGSVAPPGAVTGPVVGVTAVAPPPAGFDPTTASPAALAQYAIPPVPNASANPSAYAAWRQAVAGPLLHEAPTLTPTNISNGPARLVGPATPSNGANGSYLTTTSNNWSGSAILGFTNPKNLMAIETQFVVPTAHQAFGACTGGWDYSSLWPGIDGYNSSDVLQGGVEVDAYCSGSTKSSFYSAWVEWYPLNSTRVSSPTVSPGDLMFVEVWNTTATTGYVYFYNYSTRVSAEYAMTAPSGTTLKGNSVEWVTERPGVGGGLATLTNYIDAVFPGGVAWNYTTSPATYNYPWQVPAIGTLYSITMLDNNGAGISRGPGFNSSVLWFQDYGSACGVGTAPPC